MSKEGRVGRRTVVDEELEAVRGRFISRIENSAIAREREILKPHANAVYDGLLKRAKTQRQKLNLIITMEKVMALADTMPHEVRLAMLDDIEADAEKFAAGVYQRLKDMGLEV